MKPSTQKKVISLTDTGYEIQEASPSTSKKEGRGFYFLLGKYGQLGFALIIPLVGGILVGGWVDKKWSTHPKGTLIGILVGTILTFGSLFSIVKDFWQKNKN